LIFIFIRFAVQFDYKLTVKKNIGKMKEVPKINQKLFLNFMCDVKKASEMLGFFGILIFLY